MDERPVMTAVYGERHAVRELDAVCEEAFCRLIAQRTGILLQDHQLPNLRDTVLEGCKRFAYGNAAQYLAALRQTSDLTDQLEYLIAGVTVGESYFFRDSEQIDLLRTRLLPELISAKRESGDLSLRVWSAGCSHGQELYTIAVLLQELIPDIEKWRTHLLGTDISSEAVSRAMRGRYTEWSFRATSSALRERWFTRVGNDYEISQQIRKMASFAYLNLAADVYPSILSETNALDLILCRNVFIYLDRQTVQRCMLQFSHCLLDNGLLILGASDPTEYKHTDLELVQTESTGYFIKKCNGGAVSYSYEFRPMDSGAAAWCASAATSWSAAETGTHPLVPLAENHPTRTMPDRGTSAGQNLITPARPDILAATVPALSSQEIEPPLSVAGNGAMKSDELTEVIRLLKASNWAAVLVCVEEACSRGKESSELWQMKATALANLGRMELALQACLRSLQLDYDNKHTYLIQGLILSELNLEQEAEASLRKALYLDHTFLEAHYELGMQKVRAGNLSTALKSLNTALKLAMTGDPDRKLHNAAGMTYRRFVQVLQNEIGMLREAEPDRQSVRRRI